MPVANLSQPLVPVCDVIINGKSWSAEVGAHVASVSVSENLNQPTMFTLTLYGPAGHGNKLPWIEDRSLFAIGNEVKVKLGYGNELETMTTGVITGLDPHFARDSAPKLTVRGYDRLHRLQREPKARPFAQTKDSAIASQIAKDAGLTDVVTDSQVTHEYVSQTNKTDLALLQERARLINYEVVVDDKTLIFRPAANAKSESLTLSLQEDLLDFSPNLSSAGQVSEARVLGWNPQEKKEIVGQAKAGDEGSTIGGSRSGVALAEDAFGPAASVVADQPVTSQAEADQMAKALLQKTALSSVTGGGSCLGRTDLRSGKVIKIEGVGKMFSGEYYVTHVTHNYSPQGGYRTSFSVSGVNFSDVLLDDNQRRPTPERVFGVVVGVVTNNRDPEGLGRVKVKFPWLSGKVESQWARIAMLMAGNECGTFFLPEVDDEVLVAFDRGDARSPYVIGALWNGVDKPPADNGDGNNNLRLIKSRSGHLIKLNDEDGKETIEIIDKSEKNSFVIDTANNSITISSEKDITLSATKGKIKLDAKEVEIKSSVDGSTKIEAGGGMDVKAGGTMNIKGATVNIN